MIRRRHRTREIPFSFDSFLDVVANVVGIIIRLILVVWVGARSYTSVMAVAKPAPSAAALALASLKEPEDPLKDEIARQHDALAQAQARLLEQLRQLEKVEQKKDGAVKELAELVTSAHDLDDEQAKVDRVAAAGEQSVTGAELTLADLRERGQRLVADIQALQKLPPLKK